MTKQERKEYDAAYNSEGFKRLSNRRYYLKHRDEILRRRKSRRDGATCA